MVPDTEDVQILKIMSPVLDVNPWTFGVGVLLVHFLKFLPSSLGQYSNSCGRDVQESGIGGVDKPRFIYRERTPSSWMPSIEAFGD